MNEMQPSVLNIMKGGNSLKNKSLSINAIFNIFYKLLNVFFPLISSAYLSRILQADGIGAVAYAQNIVSYFTMIAALGIPTYGIREIAKARNNKNELNKTSSELFIINFASTTFFVLIYYFMILDFSIFQKDITLHLIFGSLIWFNFINVDWFYQGTEEYVYITIRSTIIKFISLILLFIFVKDRNDYINYAIITCLATGGNYVLNVFNLRKRVKFTIQHLNFRRHLKPILILTICSLSAELYSKVDITMLGQGNKAMVGYYSNAQKIINMALSLITAISGVFLPRLSYYYVYMKTEFNKLVSTAFKIVLFFSIPAFIGILLLSDDIIVVLFGNGFIQAAPTLKILAVLFLIKGIGDILCYQIIVSTGNEKIFIPSYILSALVNVSLNYILIPKYGINGAAIASVVAEFILNGTILINSSKLFKLSIDFKFIFSLLISNIFLFGIVYYLKLFNLSPLISVLLGTTVGFIIYIISSLIIKNEIIMLFFNKLTKKFNVFKKH